MKNNLRTTFLFASILTIGLIAAAVVLKRSSLRKPELGRTQLISAARPLAEAADLLQKEYLTPVTYEDPIWMRIANHTVFTRALDARVSFYIFVPERAGALDAALLGRVLDAYHQQTDLPRFRVVTSKMGLHIVPAEVPDGGGRFIPTKPLLDTTINVPSAIRRPSEHFQMICDAITKSGGAKLISGGPYLDQYFAPNGLILSYKRTVVTEEDIEKISFDWGASAISARDAMISLLDHSATTMAWHVLCGDGEGCVFNLKPLSVPYDRTKKPPTYIKENPKLGSSYSAETHKMERKGYKPRSTFGIGAVSVTSYSPVKAGSRLVKIYLAKGNEFIGLKSIRDAMINELTGRDINADGVAEIIIDHVGGDCFHGRRFSVYQVKAGNFVELLTTPGCPQVLDLNNDGIYEIVSSYSALPAEDARLFPKNYQPQDLKVLSWFDGRYQDRSTSYPRFYDDEVARIKLRLRPDADDQRYLSDLFPLLLRYYRKGDCETGWQQFDSYLSRRKPRSSWWNNTTSLTQDLRSRFACVRH